MAAAGLLAQDGRLIMAPIAFSMVPVVELGFPGRMVMRGQKDEVKCGHKELSVTLARAVIGQW